MFNRLDSREGIDPEADMLAQNELNEQEEMGSSEVEDDDDSDHSGYTVDDSLINSFKQQLSDVQKV